MNERTIASRSAGFFSPPWSSSMSPLQSMRTSFMPTMAIAWLTVFTPMPPRSKNAEFETFISRFVSP